MTTPAAAATTAFTPPKLTGTRIGSIVGQPKETPLFAGRQTGAESGYAGLEQALKATARVSLDSDVGQVVVKAQQDGKDRFFTFELGQYEWKDGFFRDNAYRTVPASFDVARTDSGPQFSVVSYGNTDDPRGSFRPDPNANVVGLLDDTTAVIGGEIREVKAAEPPPPPPWNADKQFVADLTEADRLLGSAVDVLKTIPADKALDPAVTPLRKQVYDANMTAQKHIERQFLKSGTPNAVVSNLRRADAFMEDANWQVVPKPSPDGRFKGIDIPGSLRDTQKAAKIIADTLAAATKDAAPATDEPADPA